MAEGGWQSVSHVLAWYKLTDEARWETSKRLSLSLSLSLSISLSLSLSISLSLSLSLYLSLSLCVKWDMMRGCDSWILLAFQFIVLHFPPLSVALSQLKLVVIGLRGGSLVFKLHQMETYFNFSLRLYMKRRENGRVMFDMFCKLKQLH